MARVSFRLRRDNAVSGEAVDVGSFTRGGRTYQAEAGVPSGSQDNDRSIRSKDFLIALPVGDASSFSATATDYTTVSLEWSITETPTLSSNVETNSQGLVGIKVMYSPLGYPESADEGIVVFNQTEIDPSTGRNIAIQTVDHVGAPEGQWAYYSIFGRYYQDSDGDGSYFYEKYASVETLVPKNFNSLNLMWKRIPQYYRTADESGDLNKFISVFSFEADRTRTLIQNVMNGYDPQVAEAEGVDQLAKLVGLEVGIDDIGIARVRALLHDIGFLRRRKGTVAGIVGYFKAISGANVDFELVGSNYRATIYAQRANLIGDPQFSTVEGTTWSVVTAGTITKSLSNGKITITNTGGSTATIGLVSKVAVPINSGTTYFNSINVSGSITYYDTLFSATVPTTVSLSGLTAHTAYTTFVDAEVSTETTTVQRTVYPITTPTSTGNKYPYMVFTLAAGQSVSFSRWMVEPNRFGNYFDGSSDFGGFLYSGNFNDHGWSGSPNASYSTFTVQRAKTKAALQKVCESIIPLTITFDPTSSTYMRFDWVPGKT